MVGPRFPGDRGEITVGQKPTRSDLSLALIVDKDSPYSAHFSRHDIGRHQLLDWDSDIRDYDVGRVIR